MKFKIPKGCWTRVTIDNKITARVKCPGCGFVAALDHDISLDGVVTPSMDCPMKECTFHEFVILEGWSE